MTFLSHAPNAEDVPLWRTLSHIAAGHYLDTGTEPADGASVTRAFYDRGWSGVLVRPADEVAALAALRPRDTIVATGDAGSVTIAGPLHVLRADPLGAEALQRMDWRSWQPWILVLPAGAETDASGYDPVMFDGVNQFYLSPAHGHLRPSLAAPANVRDNFVRAADSALAERLVATEAALHAAEARVDGSSKRLVDALQIAGIARDDVGRMAEEFVWLRGLIDEARDSEAKHRAETAWLRGVADTARTDADGFLRQLLVRAEELAALRRQLADAEMRAAGESKARAEEAKALAEREARYSTELAAMRTSTSWRITAPLRRIRGASDPPAPPAPPPTRAPTPALAAPHPAANGVLPAAAPPLPAEPAPHPPPDPAPAPDPAPERPALPAPQPAKPTHPAPRPLVTAVHQFHAGSASGDAITNAMLLIRAQLRAAGFRSDIFVENRGPGVDHDIKLMDSLPRHDGYVLLLHHSMGFPSFPAILDLPAPKVLIYHNITPPELLANVPRIERQARMGRDQLATLRDHVAFALADSDFNAVELHTLGFAAIRTCTLLFDTAALTRRATGLRPADGVFTVLFVGRVTPSKAQDELVDAFAAFRAGFGRPCRLVLVGALDADEHVFLTAIRNRVAAHGLEADIHLPGLVTERELHDWYRQADLYVSLSRHEGFGVPLVEALAHAIPVVAWPTGAVPYTLGDAATVLTARDPAHVAAAMLAAAGHHDAKRATAAIARWSLDRQMPVLMEALAAAGAVPPGDRASQPAIAANLQVTVCGHVAKTYSLAAINRSLARTLEAQRPGTVRLRPVEGAPTAELGEVPEPERAFVAALAGRPPPDTGPELVLSGHYPLYVPDHRGDLLAALFFWEESLIPAATVADLNRSFGAVFAPSQAVAKALVDSGIAIPVLNLGQAPELSRFAASRPAPHPGPFTFLHVSSAFPRKGLDVLLAAWARAFTTADPVRLVIKTFPNPHNDAASQIAQLRTAHPGAAPIELVDADLGADALLDLYAQAGAMVLPSRGEGFNLPAAEAMAAGVPVITTGHGGHLDFCTPQTARLVARRLAPSSSHLAPPHSLWAEPDPDDLGAALQEAASGALAARAGPARAAILAHTDAAAFTTRLTQAAARLLTLPPPPPVRLTWVTTWSVRCGIAEYSRTLLGALPRGGLAEPVILADERTPPCGGARAAWRLGDEASVAELIAAVAAADGDVTVIQHQPGLLQWPWLGRLVDSLADAGKPAVVTLHNTTHLRDIAEADRSVTVHALRRAARVLVHTLADVERLDALGLAAVTTLLPHPAPTPAEAPVRPLPPDAAPVLGCTGFFLPDKGIGVLIAAAARLRSRWPGIRLRLVNAEYDDPVSAAEIAACRTLAHSLGLAVEWHTGFVTLDEQQALLRGCDLIVLPYQRSKEASSAALRSALATGIPVAVTPLPLFDEAAGVVFRLPGMAAAPVELGLASLLGNTDRRAALAAAARGWMADRALPDVARRLHGMLLGLAAQARLGQPTDGSAWQAQP